MGLNGVKWGSSHDFLVETHMQHYPTIYCQKCQRQSEPIFLTIPGINSHLCEKCFSPFPIYIYIHMTLYSIAYPTTIFSMSTFLVKDDKHALIVTKNEKRAKRLFCLTPLTCSLWTKFIWQVAGTV